MAKQTKNKQKLYKTNDDAFFNAQNVEAQSSNDNKIKSLVQNIKISQNIKPKNEKQLELIQKIYDNEIVFVAGPAGTGKTIIALKASLEILFSKNNSMFKKILITKPIIEAAENIGALPGTILEKTQPFMFSFESNITKLIGEFSTKLLYDSDVIKFVPLAYMRGVTFDNSIAVLDECITDDTKISIKLNNKYGISKQMIMKKMIYQLDNGKSIDVLSYNASTNVVESKPVKHLFKNGIKEVCEISFNNGLNKTYVTENHPFAIFEHGEIIYKKLVDLNVGDNVIRLKNIDTNNASIFFKNDYDMLLGFILGDGSFLKNNQKQTGYRLSKNHGLKQLDYCNFCANIFDVVPKMGKAKSGYTNKPLVGFSSKTLIVDDKFYSSCYNTLNEKKKITPDIENFFSIRTLALWYMDDGWCSPKRTTKSTVASDNLTVGFCTHSFSNEEVMILQNILQKKFLINSSISITKKLNKTYNILLLKKEGKRRLFEILRGYIHPNLYYKTKNTSGIFKESLYNASKAPNLTISTVFQIKPREPKMVYNIEVADNNNYFANNILVHNCQNTTKAGLKLFLSRKGETSKLIVIGDIEQTDLELRRGEINSLEDAFSRFKDINKIGFIKFTEDDIVRSNLLIEVMKRYKLP